MFCLTYFTLVSVYIFILLTNHSHSLPPSPTEKLTITLTIELFKSIITYMYIESNSNMNIWHPYKKRIKRIRNLLSKMLYCTVKCPCCLSTIYLQPFIFCIVQETLIEIFC